MLFEHKLHKYEVAALANLCPETSEEATTLIPSIKGKLDEDELQKILDDIQTKRSLS